jgi:hypothetical protein
MSRTIEAQAFIDAACRQTGLEDFGIEGWRENLDALIDSFNREAALSAVGEQLVGQWMLRRLTNRLRVVEHWRRHPELASEHVRRPLFVCGMMRTGTTILYELLHTDPSARCLMKWESMACVPPPRAGSFDDDPRLLQARKEVEEVFARTPDAKAAHYEAPDGPTECVELLTQHFAAQDWSWWHVPSYLDHFNRCDMHGAMAYHCQCLKLLQSQAPGPWRLKAPAHLLYLDALFDTYPDALVVITHRDPVKCVASMAHMSCSYRPEILSDVHTHAGLERFYGALWLENLGTMVDKMMDVRTLRPDAAIYDVHYHDLARDPLAVFSHIYDFLGEPFTAEVEGRMRRHLDDNPGDRFGTRKFTPEQFGLDDAAVHERFERYYDRFEIVRGA